MSEQAHEYLTRFAKSLLAISATGGKGEAVDLDIAATESVDLIKESARLGGKTLLVGNGGSAAVVSHMHNDLCKAGGVRALVFTEQPLLTAYSNDDGYDAAFESSARLWADPTDLLIAISSSGESSNILRTCDAVEERGGKIITLSGFDTGNPLRNRGQVNFYVESSSYGIVETAHAALGHYLTDAVAGLLDTGDQS